VSMALEAGHVMPDHQHEGDPEKETAITR
jgi:hypothetical protein